LWTYLFDVIVFILIVLFYFCIKGGNQDSDDQYILPGCKKMEPEDFEKGKRIINGPNGRFIKSEATEDMDPYMLLKRN